MSCYKRLLGFEKKVQDLLEAKEIEFDALEIPNVITTPMPKHGRGVNAMEDDVFVIVVDELITPLLTIKRNLLKASLFLGCGEGCHFCLFLPTCCHLLKADVQCLMDDREILIEKNLVPTIACRDVSIITISANPPRVSTKRTVRITSVPKITPLIITAPGPILYSSDKTGALQVVCTSRRSEDIAPHCNQYHYQIPPD